jgi:hypothetical protein
VSYCYDCAANVQEACGTRCLLADDNRPMPQTPAERQEARRKRLLMEGLIEVRGIFLHPDQHAELKAYAQKLAKKRPKIPTKGA